MFRENSSVIIASILSLLVIAQYLCSKFGYKVGLLMSYFFGNAFLYMTAHNSILTRRNAAHWILEHVLLLVFFGMLSKIKTAMAWHFVLISTAIISVCYYLASGSHYGLIDAYTFESAMLMFAVLMPSPYKKSIFGLAFTISCASIALLIGGSTTLGILVVYILGTIFYSKYKNIKIATAGLMIIGALIAHKFTDLLNDSGRIANWTQYITHWSANFNMLYGTGIGSFKNLSHFAGDLVSGFLYAHNDFLEIFLETGHIGLTIFLTLCWMLLKEAHKSKQAHIVLMMFLFMANYFPNQILLCKFMFVLTIFMIISKNKQNVLT